MLIDMLNVFAFIFLLGLWVEALIKFANRRSELFGAIIGNLILQSACLSAPAYHLILMFRGLT